MVEGVLFVGTAIAGVTQFVKLLVPRVNGAITILAAVLTGVVVAMLDTQIGVVDITIAEGIMTALATSGVVGTLKQVGHPSVANDDKGL